MSRQNVQSRFVVEFDNFKMLIDTPNNTVQGFAVNMKCDRFETVFNEDDHAILFRDNNLWLFIDDNTELDIDEAETIVSVDKYRKMLEKIFKK